MIHFSAEKIAYSCRKMHFPAEKCGFGGHMTGNRRKSQEGCRAQEARALANFHKKPGAEIWEGDERRRFQFLKCGDSLNGQNLFTELPFLSNSLPKPPFIEYLAVIQ